MRMVRAGRSQPAATAKTRSIQERWCTVTMHTECPSQPEGADESLTVAEVVAKHAANLRDMVAWAQRRLNQAAILIEFSIGPADPAGGRTEINEAQKALVLAEIAAEDVMTVIMEHPDPHPPVLYLIKQAFDRYSTLPGAPEEWSMPQVARWTVAELRARLGRQPEHGAAAQPGQGGQ